jgi:hypothetical protein
MEEIDWIVKRKMNRDRQKLPVKKAGIIYTVFIKNKLKKKREKKRKSTLETEMKTPENLCNNKLLI